MTKATGSQRLLPTSARGLPSAFWWIWLSILVNWTGGFVGPLLTLYMTSERGYSAAHAGAVISLIGLGGVLGTIGGGIAADRFGRRSTLFAAHCWTAVCMTSLGLVQAGWAIAVAAFAMGAGAAAARPAMQAALADVVPPEDRQRAFALNYWALNLGVAVSSVLAGVMVTHGYVLVFVADAAATALCAVLVMAKVPETRPRTAPKGSRSAEARPQQKDANDGSVWKDRPFLAFCFAALLFACVFQQGSTMLPIVVARDGHDPTVFTWLHALNGVLIVTLQVALTRLVRERSRAGTLLAASLLLAVGFGLMAFADGVIAYALCVVIWTFGEMLQAPAGSSVAADRAPERLRGRYQGLYGTAWTAAAFLAPAGGGLLLDFGGPGVLWGVCAALAVVAGVIWAWITGPLSKLARHEFRSGVRAGNGSPSPAGSPSRESHPNTELRGQPS
ncbi:MFS transporter [Streptomyces flavidovirens]|uniref:MDR family MFS transporter n=1 Tax=Streptomyces flavidovirens TaxID=67298 RepID=A0ABW6RF56_9ACTN